MNNVGREEVAAAAERMRASFVKDQTRFEGHLVSWTCSIGYPIGTNDDLISTLISEADDALYRAKSAGRTCVESAGK